MRKAKAVNSTTNLAKLPASYNVPTAFKDAKNNDIMEDKVQGSGRPTPHSFCKEKYT